MAKLDYAELLKTLLPRGDCWEVSRGSILDRMIGAFSLTFSRIQQELDILVEAYFSNFESLISSRWKNRDERPLNLSMESLKFQLKEAGYPQVEVTDERRFGAPFVLSFRSPALPMKYLSCGDPVGTYLNDYRDYRLESLVDEMKPAHCKAEFEYYEEVK